MGIAELDGGWINGRGYGGNVEAKGPRDLGHRVLIRRTRRAPARLTQGKQTDWAGVSIKEVVNVIQLPEVAEKMREYFAAIAKKVQDRQNTLKESMEDLHAKVEQMKNQKKSDQQTLIK